MQSLSQFSSGWLLNIVVALMFVLIAHEDMPEKMPKWPLLIWLLAMVSLAASHFYIYRRGGAAATDQRNSRLWQRVQYGERLLTALGWSAASVLLLLSHGNPLLLLLPFCSGNLLPMLLKPVWLVRFSLLVLGWPVVLVYFLFDSSYDSNFLILLMLLLMVYFLVVAVDLQRWKEWLADLLHLRYYFELQSANLQDSNTQLQLLKREYENQSVTDPLTGIGNRRFFDIFIEQEWQRCHRQQQYLSLLMIDIDYFKQYNDSFGHLVGDQCLRQVALAIQERTARRAGDQVARYGGEEFAIVLPNTDARGALGVAQCVQRALQELSLPYPGQKSGMDYVTASIGVTSISVFTSSSVARLIQDADHALYQAKEKGRNQIAVAKNSALGEGDPNRQPEDITAERSSSALASPEDITEERYSSASASPEDITAERSSSASASPEDITEERYSSASASPEDITEERSSSASASPEDITEERSKTAQQDTEDK